MAFNFDGPKLKVDKDCSMKNKNFNVFQDYSCVLIDEDVAYSMIAEVRVFKMQILEREDKQKWVLWTASGKLKESEFNDDSSDDDQPETSPSFIYITKDFFNKADAQTVFEKKFVEKTGNKWADRDYFKEKAGKFQM